MLKRAVGQRFEGASWLVPPLALGRLYQSDPLRALDFAERYGRCTGDQARRCGLNWVLGPVCDVNNNPANPVINVRAWGEDAATAGTLAAAFQRGLSRTGVLGCAKHFPGHGDTSSDSHLDLPVLPHSKERLAAVELPPFQEVIAAGVHSVMTAHLLLPELDPNHPATLSTTVLTNLLRHDLHFDGLVVTDALVMEAITKRYGAAEAAVLAFEAGADLILMPADADAAIDGLCNAFRSGRLPMQRLEDSLQRRRQAAEANRQSPSTQPSTGHPTSISVGTTTGTRARRCLSSSSTQHRHQLQPRNQSDSGGWHRSLPCIEWQSTCASPTRGSRIQEPGDPQPRPLPLATRPGFPPCLGTPGAGSGASATLYAGQSFSRHARQHRAMVGSSAAAPKAPSAGWSCRLRQPLPMGAVKNRSEARHTSCLQAQDKMPEAQQQVLKTLLNRSHTATGNADFTD